jgi:hypothetical protein
MSEPSDKAFFFYFLFALFCSVAIHLRLYGVAAFYAFAAYAIKEGW